MACTKSTIAVAYQPLFELDVLLVLLGAFYRRYGQLTFTKIDNKFRAVRNIEQSVD